MVKQKTKNKPKKKMSQRKRSIITMSVLAFSIITLGLILGIRMNIPAFDSGIGGIIYVPPDDGVDPEVIPFQTPFFALESAKVSDLSKEDFTFEIYVVNSENVESVIFVFFIDGEEAVTDIFAGSGASGLYKKNYNRNTFGYPTIDNVITINVELYYTDPNTQYTTHIRKVSVVDAFSFDVADVEHYMQPEIIPNTFGYSLEGTFITFSFATVNYQYITSFVYSFITDDEIIIDEFATPLTFTMTADGDGIYSTIFDLNILPTEKTIYMDLTMNFIDQNAQDDSLLIEDFVKFGGDVTGEGSINYLYLLLVTFAVSSIIILRRK